VHHLYVHVPFCQRRCAYCDFSIAVRKRIPAQQYVETIRRELEQTTLAGPLETIYLGGGTPSLLPGAAIAALLDTIASTVPLDETAEITLEANPEDVTDAAAAVWRGAGINRISLGVQSFDDRVLQWMHRVHDAPRARAAVRMLRAAGFDNLSLDLIFALPPHVPRDWGRDLETAIACEPEHLSLYGLTVEPRTPLQRWIARGAARVPSDERYAEEYLAAHAQLGAAGFVFYEVSNAARNERRSRHNSAYWLGRPYGGVGPAAHAFDGRVRSWNLPAWEAYRRAVVAGRSAVESAETLTDTQRGLERVYLGLRTRGGVPLAEAGSPAVLAPLIRQGWLVQESGRVKCSVEGWLRLDALVAALTGPSTTS
jgi:oxygen-independent coproporphyrinogen-3 oxidase